MTTNPLRRLPSVHVVLEHPAVRALAERYSRAALVAAVRVELGARRRLLLQAGEPASVDLADVALAVQRRVEADAQPRLGRVINATGILLHTNLGRAPMAAVAAQAAHEAAAGYVNLELDLDSGKRASRQDVVRDLLSRLTGAESATVVNNNAAATLLTLRVVGRGREVVVSRGQLIEIGGSFRLPEIMSLSGAILREVGTTNITRLADYEAALGPATAALLRVHPSNYRLVGFTETPSLTELSVLARKHHLPLIDDIGSGALVDCQRFGLSGEPLARDSVAAGADLVLFSGDKLLGGPQAGIIVGAKAWIERIEKDPLMRAVRIDKMTLAALEATLRLYLNEDTVVREVPVLRLLATPLADLEARAHILAGRLSALPSIAEAAARRDEAYAGGGSLPAQALPTWVVAVKARLWDDVDFARRLRLGTPAVMPRLGDGAVLLDLRAVFPEQIEALVDAVATAAQADDDPTG
ncbi:MAG: L-seryl-tRNA(Sec) selenium transferase [Gemmataceae bacterium]|nr:L-seryl-tRNA(Sec) selenium transferase [Gemmataceae bacterium]